MRRSTALGPLAPALRAALIAGLTAALAGLLPAKSAQAQTVRAWLTVADSAQRLEPQPALAMRGGPAQGLVIEVDPQQRFQTMVGFGASITDASAWLLRHRMREDQRKALMRDLFGQAEGEAGFNFTRLTLGASDYSLRHYTYDDMPPGQEDLPLRHFSLEEMRRDVLPVLREALVLNPRLKVMASPWSAPAWMKTTDSLIKGRLRPDRRDAYARYLVRYVEEMAAEGVDVFALTLQNEPHVEPEDYPGMRLDPPDRVRLIADHLGPLLRVRGLKTQILEWDHNWDEPGAALAVLNDPQAAPFVDGVAWHCYAGEPAAQSQVALRHPGKDTWFTECSGGQWSPLWRESLPWMARQVLIGSTRHGARGVQLWNIALDERHGPHLGGCRDCRGVVTIDSATGAVTRNLEYYVLAHASRFVKPGAQRIASTSGLQGVDTVAFRHPGDGSISLVMCNSSPDTRPLVVSADGKVVDFTMPPHSLATLVWTPR